MDVLLNELARGFEVVVECVRLFVGVGNVAGVADGGLDNAAGLADGVNAKLQIVHVIQGIENAEHIHAGFDSLVAKLFDLVQNQDFDGNKRKFDTI